MPDHMEGIHHHFLTVFEVFNANGDICRFAVQRNVIFLIGKLHTKYTSKNAIPIKNLRVV